MKKTIHPLALIFPAYGPTEKAKLQESMKENGQREAIVLFEDQIVDGRNRYESALELGLDPKFRTFNPETEGSVVRFIADANLNRRHLSPGQRASVAAKIEEALKAEAAKPKPLPRPPLGDETPEEKAARTPKVEGSARVIEEALEAAEDLNTEDAPPVVVDESNTADARPFRKVEAEAAEAAGASPRALRDFKFVEKHSKADSILVTKGEITLNEGVKRAKSNKELQSSFRNSAADQIESDHKEEFADLVREGEALKTDGAIKAFARLDVRGQRKLVPYLSKGYGFNDSQKFASGKFETKDKLAMLINWFETMPDTDKDEAGWGTFTLDGYVLAISKAPKTEAES